MRGARVGGARRAPAGPIRMPPENVLFCNVIKIYTYRKCINVVYAYLCEEGGKKH